MRVAVKKIKILIVDYDPDWPRRFEIEARRITAALRPRALAVDHVGSTSVRGLAAKPIIDICLSVSDSSDEASYIDDLVASGGFAGSNLTLMWISALGGYGAT